MELVEAPEERARQRAFHGDLNSAAGHGTNVSQHGESSLHKSDLTQ